jgi:hypothetical protein
MNSIQDGFNSFKEGYSDMDKIMIVLPGASCSFDSSIIGRSRSHSELLAPNHHKVHSNNSLRGHFYVAVKRTF